MILSPTDQLVVGCRRSPEAFHSLVAHYGEPVYTFLVQMAGRENAGGLFPEVWLRIHQASGGYAPEGNAAGFIFATAHETAQGYYAPPAGASLELKEAVAGLPAQLRLIFLMRQLGDITYKTIARRLGLPLQTVLERMNAALDQLAQPLEKHRA